MILSTMNMLYGKVSYSVFMTLFPLMFVLNPQRKETRMQDIE